MKLNELSKTGAVRLPWPTILNGERLLNTHIKESEICLRKCGGVPGCQSDPRLGEHECDYGLSYFRLVLPNNDVLVYGLKGPENTSKVNSYNRAGIKGRSVTRSDISAWQQSLQDLLDSVDRAFLERQTEMLHPLHDPIKLAKQIEIISNRLVQVGSVGTTFDLQVENAAPELKTLVKAAKLLSDSFDLLEIYFNPAAARYGQLKSIGIHGLLMKLVSIFRLDSSGQGGVPIRINLSGFCHRNAFVYESFKLIPFALLSNAVKYRVLGDIDVTVVERPHAAEISVQSVGPFIEEKEYRQIFEKQGRGMWAKASGKEGQGVGLYLADIISKVHGFEIRVSSRKTGEKRNGIPLAVNKFWFELAYQR